MGPAKRAGIAVTATLLLAAASLPSVAGETYYRWVDEDGAPMNSDHPPPTGIEYEKITVGSGLHRRTPLKENTPPPAEAGQPGAAPPEQAPSAGQHTSNKDPEACRAARQNLETLNTRARIRMPDGDGSYRFLSEEDKELQREQAKTVILRACE